MSEPVNSRAVAARPRAARGQRSPLPQPSSRPDAVSGSARIAAEIGTAVLAGLFQPGDVIPSEHTLCGQFAASRSVVREALKVVAAKGLVAPRRRAGTQVRARSEWRMLDPEVLAWRLAGGADETKLVADLMDVRAVVEPAAAAMAALHHTPATIAAIAHAFAQMQRASGDRALFAEPDLAFHRAILAATGNDVMAAFGALIEAALAAFVRIASRHPGAPGPSVPLHGAVLEAIRRRDSAGAQAAMSRLLARTADNARRNARPRAAPRAGTEAPRDG